MNRRILVLLGALAAAASSGAGAREQITAEEFLDSLTFHEGNITLPGGMASLVLLGFVRMITDMDGYYDLYAAFGATPDSKPILFFEKVITTLKWTFPGMLLMYGARDGVETSDVNHRRADVHVTHDSGEPHRRLACLISFDLGGLGRSGQEPR